MSGRPARIPRYVLAAEPSLLPDPGDGGRIAPATAAAVRLVSQHAGAGETRELADPLFVGQELDLCFEAAAGDIVITADSAVNQAGETVLTFADAGDHLRLVGGRDGSRGTVWRVISNDGVALA